jgi:tetratricopeptide (TPR) repeat protein
VYNKRIEFFGEKGYVLGRQGVNLLRYGKDRFPEAYKYLHESVELEGLETSAATASTMMQTSAAMFKAGKHEAIQVVADFGLAMDIIEPATEAERIKAAKSTDEKEKGKAEHRYQNLKLASKNVEILFVNSGAASCTHLVKYYSEKFAQAPTDIKLLQKITKVLGDAECDDSELFAKAAEQQHKLDPSARSAYSLARMFAKKEDYDKSVAYFKQAIDLERKADAPNGDFISKAAYQLGGVYFVKKQFSEARSACREAIKAEPGWGKPYILIGKLYASSGATCTNSENLDQGAVYWAAVDKFVQAKQVDNDVEAECNDLISRYKKYYPKKDEAFFYGITKGQSYSIGCWIGETTTARFE